MYVGVIYKRSGSDEYGGRAYTYKSELPLSVGDRVVCPTAKGDSPAQVVEINVPEGRIDERWADSIREITVYQQEGTEESE